MEVITLTLGDLSTHCYIPYCPKTGAAVIIDPADAGSTIVDTILESNCILSQFYSPTPTSTTYSPAWSSSSVFKLHCSCMKKTSSY